MVRSIAKNLLLQASGIPGAGDNWTTVADIETCTFTFSNAADEVFTKDSPNYRQFLSGGGTVKSADISGEGVFTNSTDHNYINDHAINGNPPIMRFRTKDGTTGRGHEANFFIESFEESAGSTGATVFSMSLKSDGPIVTVSGL